MEQVLPAVWRATGSVQSARKESHCRMLPPAVRPLLLPGCPLAIQSFAGLACILDSCFTYEDTAGSSRKMMHEHFRWSGGSLGDVLHREAGAVLTNMYMRYQRDRARAKHTIQPEPIGCYIYTRRRNDLGHSETLGGQRTC